MIKKIGYLILAGVLMFAGVSTFFTSKVYAQGNTKVVLSTDKSYYNVGDTVKVTVQAQNAVDLFGVQFTLHYDPGMLSMEGNDFTFSDGYTVFGGSTVDKGKGILTYPVINKNPSPDNKDSVTVGYANFKASKEGPVTLNMDNIKSVNSQSVETNYNTQTQSVFNIAKAPDSTPGNNNPGNNPNGGSNGSGNNNGGSAGNTNPGSSANNGGNSGSSSNNGNSGNGSSSSSGGNSYGSINSDSNNGGLTASADSNGNQAVNGNTNTASQSGNGNSTNQNTASNDTKNGAEGSTQNSSKNDTANKQTLDSNSKSPLNIILLIVVIVVVIGGAVFAFLNRKTLKDTFSKITNKKD